MNIHDLQLHFSIRKLSVGVVSCLIGICFISSNQTVQADSMPIASNNKSVIISNSSSNSNPTETKSSNKQDIVDSNNTSPAQIDSHSNQNSRSNSNPTETIASKSNNKQNIVDSNNTSPAQINSHSNQNSTKMVLVNSKLNISSQQPATADSAENKLKTAALNSTIDEKLDAKMLSESKAISPANDTNGGFDEATWGKLDVNDWKGNVQGDYYQLTDYTGDYDHVIVPNEADFEKAGISTSGKQVGVTSDFFKNIKNILDNSNRSIRSLAFSKTAEKQVKAIGNDWNYAFSSYGFSKFNGENLDVSNVTNMNDMFFNCSNLSDISSLANWDTSKVTDMNGMFFNCSNLSDVSPLANWDTSKVTDMSGMFKDCSNLSDVSPLAHWDTSKVTNMNDMFGKCSNLSDISPLANWNTSNVTDMRSMFENCSNLSDISSLANWDTSKVNSMSGMFENTPLKKVTLTNWDFSNIDPFYESIFPDTNFEATLSDKTSKSLLDISSNLSDPAKENLKIIDSAPIVDGVPDVNGDIQDCLNSIKHAKEEYQQQLAYCKQQIDYYKKELADPNADAGTKKNSQDELKQAEQEYQSYLTGDGKKSFDEQIQDLQGELEQCKQYIQQEINQIKLHAEYPLNSVFGNHSKITTPNRDLLIYLVGKLPVKSDAATRTIEITFPDGTKKTINQSVGYGKYAISGTADMATHKLDMAMPYELSKWELIKKEDGSYDLVEAHVDKNGVASFDNVALPKIPGYKAKVSKNNGLLLVSYLALAPEKPETIINLNELQFSNKLATNSAVQFNSTVKSNIVVKSDMYQVVNDDHNWQLPVIKSYDLKFATNKNQIIFAYTKDKQYNYRFVLTFKDGQYRLTTFDKQGKLLKTYSIKSYKKLAKIIHSLVSMNIA